MKVEFVHWPVDQDRRSVLAAAKQPCLLLIDGDNPPPTTASPIEDWIRLPADEDDLEARIQGLAEAHRQHDRPALDGDGLLHFRERWIAVPPIEASLVGVLVEQFGIVVSRDRLTTAGWPEAAPGRNALDVHVLRLRRRIKDLGLAIRTVRSRGYLLEAANSGAINSAFVQ